MKRASWAALLGDSRKCSWVLRKTKGHVIEGLGLADDAPDDVRELG
jgi:hypothetical protein